MKFISTIVVVLLSNAAFATDQHQHHTMSPYTEETGRQIKSLSEADIGELMRGGGWGFAKPAELNGYPGPSHLLSMKDEIGLTKEQVGRVQSIFEDMQRRAIQEGQRFVAAERELDAAFKNKTVTERRLRALIDNAENSRSRLRLVHLAGHLEVTAILTPEQIAKYNELRGYRK
ncbi:Spy/CpxP family protein refolding chaperone [Rhizobium leguminosarum]|uniref:Spy/CpxP family protein refolding chaperone n=1 Tax=Rhizobium leguminosarum TaxID=384 RepID=UPI0014415905|nr:periplasmic heavy metal sensor [Rhizobium leguminosarum]NKN00853.1 periplasmic heavy metal sensor [Rhizobium leguminosarum bv. viciae]